MRRFAGALLLALLAASPVRADSSRLEGFWGGLKGADILFSAAETEAGWEGRIAIRSAGFLRVLGGFDTEVEAHGPVGDRGAIPEDYSQHVISRSSDRIVEVRYAGEPILGSRVRDLVLFADPSRSKRDGENLPEPPESMRMGAIDPLSAILALGRHAIAGETRFTLPVYDGRRRFDVEVAVLGPGRIEIGGQERNSLRLRATVHPLAGFRPFHLRWWTDAKFDIALDPRSGMPLRVASDSFLVAVVVTAKALCPPANGCELPAAK